MALELRIQEAQGRRDKAAGIGTVWTTGNEKELEWTLLSGRSLAITGSYTVLQSSNGSQKINLEQLSLILCRDGTGGERRRRHAENASMMR